MIFQMEREELVPSTFALPRRPFRKPTRMVLYVLALLEVCLGLRFMLQLAGASPDAPFIWFLYVCTKPFLLVFEGAFATQTFLDGHVFESTTLLAMFVYAIVAWFVVQYVAIHAQKHSYTFNEV